MRTIYIQDFGAKGDGVTDDARAITNAVIALHEAGPGSVLIFEKDTIYYHKDTPDGLKTIFHIRGTENVTIKGDNTKIITDSPNNFFNVTENKNFTLEGITFDYKIKPYFLTEEMTELDTKTFTAVFKIDRDINIPTGEYFSYPTNDGAMGFGIIDMPVGRWHMFLRGYEKLDERLVKVFFSESQLGEKEMLKRLEMLREERLILPLPYVAHWVNTMCNIINNTNFTLKNINIQSGSKFMFSVCNNEGLCVFDTVNLLPEEKENLDFLCWRDGWHLKENHAKFIWDNCKATGLQDDIFNISSSVMEIKEVINPRTINMFWKETGGPFRWKMCSGEKVQIVNSETGVILGETRIACVIKQAGPDNIITLSDEITGLTAGEEIKVLFPELVANDSEIKNCWFDGTNRFRGPITITDTFFNNRRLWLDLLGGSWLEAPVPRDIIFRNCEFKFESEPKDEKFVHLSSYNDNTAPNSYHIKNIRFEGCVVDESKFEIGTGDEVVFTDDSKGWL